MKDLFLSHCQKYPRDIFKYNKCYGKIPIQNKP